MIGPYDDEMVEHINYLQLQEHVSLMGELPYKEVAHHVSRANVFVMFSFSENFPCVVVEALCCGLPVITTDVAGIKEAVNQSNGILVEPGNEEQLLTAIIHVRNNYGHYKFRQISEAASASYNLDVIGRQF